MILLDLEKVFSFNVLVIIKKKMSSKDKYRLKWMDIVLVVRPNDGRKERRKYLVGKEVPHCDLGA